MAQRWKKVDLEIKTANNRGTYTRNISDLLAPHRIALYWLMKLQLIPLSSMEGD